jgi:uncharacterized lipoprotein YddW (UPF0748 family)
MHSEPLSDFFNSRFYQEHPQWRCTDQDGTTVARMSFAVPQVRAHLVDVLREAVHFGADGANVIYARGVPFVLYEKPFSDLCRQRFGKDPKTLDPSDPQVLQLRVEVMTSFMREVRAMLDDEGARRNDGKRLELSAIVFADEADNLKYGLDLRRWVAEGLLDSVIPYRGAGGAPAKQYDMTFFRDVCKAKKVPVRPTFIGWKSPSLSEMMQQAAVLYDAGADGLTFWDGNSGSDHTDRWSVVSRLGHVDELRERTAEGAPSPVTLRFHSLGALVMDGQYSPNWGY